MSIERNIKLLNDTRKQTGVNAENPYIFAKSSFNSVCPIIRSSNCLCKFATECGVEKIADITVTN